MPPPSARPTSSSWTPRSIWPRYPRRTATGGWWCRSAASDAWAAARRESVGHGPALRVVFFGLYTPLQGTPVIGAALRRLAGAPVEITMVGHGQDEAETKRIAAANPGVTWLDWVSPAELPALVADQDVCLGIFGTGAKALRVVPNKVFQGAAAGCAIVTSDTAPQRRALGDAAAYVPPGDGAALAETLLRLAGDRAELSRLRAAASRVAQREFAPARVVRPLVSRLRQALDGWPSGPARHDPARRG